MEQFIKNAPQALINIKLNNKLIQSTAVFIKNKELSEIQETSLLNLIIKWTKEIEKEIERTGA